MPKCPKGLAENLRYRREIAELGRSSKLARDEIYMACQRDPVWWMDTFCFTFNPREFALNPIRPFITYDFQEVVTNKVMNAMGKHDLLIPKSRAMGATYIILYTLLHSWLFRGHQSFLLTSAKQDRVDNGKADPSSLMWKIDHALQTLPEWMVPEFNRAELRILNEENGSVFSGESTNANPDRGGRRTAILADEAAAMPNCDMVAQSISHCTNTCLWVSTFQGAYGHFHSLWKKWSVERPDWIISLKWTQHPLYSQGLTYDADGKATSPWYRDQCARAASKRSVASEIDMDPQASGGAYFEQELIDELLKMSVLDPTCFGDLEEDGHGDPIWCPSGRGHLSCWFEPNDEGKPPKSVYVIGFDIATGKGGSLSSQSCAAVYDAITGEKMAEFKSNKITPTTFARYANLLGRWFYNAKLNWGSIGPGSDFGKTLIEDCQYGHVYFRMEEGTVSKKRTRKYGYPEIGEPRQVLFATYYDALHNKRIINRSREAVLELGQFIFSPDGTVQHCEAIQKEQDPENKGKLHGDLCFIAGTMIQTPAGEVPIELVRAGDIVCTRTGPRRVLVSGATGGAASVWSAKLSNGRELVGTAGHPIFTENRGWVGLSKLMPSDILYGCQDNTKHRSKQKLLNLTEFDSTEGRNRATSIFRGTTGHTLGIKPGELGACTLRYGNPITAQFLQAAISTIEMAIRSITPSKIWRALLCQSTTASMAKDSHCVAIDTKESSTTFAATAALPSDPSCRKRPGTAERHVRRHTEEPIAFTTKRQYARSVKRHSSQINTPHGEHAGGGAPINCRVVEEVQGVHTVYNLAVEGAPEYFAQGVLVHNCVADAMANILLRERKTLQARAPVSKVLDPKTAHFAPHTPGYRYQQLMQGKRKKAYY